VTVIGAAIAGAPIVPGVARPAAPFLPWAAITILVATAEEGILRGVLFDRLRAVGGLFPAVVVTTVAFALLHVPLYGWDVVPLDLAVGLGLVGLRLSTRTVLAPIVAHAVADLATWWL
jgi:membrane protease YdiL (CAAX protease family)